MGSDRKAADRSGPINVALPNTIEQKMRAICALCDTVRELAQTVASVNVHTVIANNTLYGNNGAGMVVAPEPSAVGTKIEQALREWVAESDRRQQAWMAANKVSCTPG
jgi:hypothetical protein